jgi:hypothetical protein
MSRIDQARGLAHDFGFDWLFDYADLEMTSCDLPYHNWFHTCCMICNCIEGAQYYNLDFRQCHLIGVAALFHDFNHSGGTKTDHQNINIAVANLREAAINYNPMDLNQMVETIRVTQYPFIHTPKTIEQKIIRDADLMQVLEPEWYEHVILGLQAEFKAGGKDYTLEEMLQGQMVFLQEHIPTGLFTDWAIGKFMSPYGWANPEYQKRKDEIYARMK